MADQICEVCGRIDRGAQCPYCQQHTHTSCKKVILEKRLEKVIRELEKLLKEKIELNLK